MPSSWLGTGILHYTDFDMDSFGSSVDIQQQKIMDDVILLIFMTHS